MRAGIRHVARVNGVRRRAMTLLEVLLAIAIVAILMGILVAWLPTAARATSMTEHRRATTAAREAVFALIARDLAVHDADENDVSRVAILPGDVLQIETRARDGDRAGRVERELRYDPGSRLLEVRDRRPDGTVTRRPIAHGVRTWSCVRPEGSDVFDVTIAFDGAPENAVHTRRFALP